MISFAVCATVMVIIALACVLPALLRKEDVSRQHIVRDEINLSVLRDQLSELDKDLAEGTLNASSFESSKREIERRLIEELKHDETAVATTKSQRWVALGIAVAIPVAAIALYMGIGSVVALDPTQVVAQDKGHEVTEAQVVAMVAGLAEKLKAQPENIEGWNMLARSYSAMGKFNEAADAYAHLVKLAPTNADFLISYADILAVTLNKNLQGEPDKLIKRALEMDPQNVRGLSLAGSAAFDRRDYQGAIVYWKKILTLVLPDSDMAKLTLSSIGEAQALLNGGTIEPMAAANPAAMPAVQPQQEPVSSGIATAQVSGTVTLSPALKASVSENDVVFIFAKAAQGPQFPLAVMRKQVKDLPTSFVLDDSMGVVPNVKLSGYPQLVVGARISKSGNATPSAGDLEGVVEPVALGAKDVKITISTQRK